MVIATGINQMQQKVRDGLHALGIGERHVVWRESLHPRDRLGRWVHVPGNRQSSSLPEYVTDANAPSTPRVAALDSSLRKRGYALHDAIDHYHWFHGNSAVGGEMSFRRISFARPWPKPVAPLPEDPSMSYYTANADESREFSEKVLHTLPAREQETLHRLTYGDIPASWGHEKAYTDHLRKWSKGSALVDKDGLPWRIFHGTAATFSSFDPTHRGESTDRDDARQAFFFATSPEDAGFFAFYGMTELNRQDQQPNIMPVHVRLKNPLVVVDQGGEMDSVLFANTLEFAKEHGYDGMVSYNAFAPKGVKLNRLADRVEDSEMILRDLYTPNGPLVRVPRMTVCAFNPQDIKSAVGNSGDFSESADMGKSIILLPWEWTHVPSLYKSSNSQAPLTAPKAGTVISYKHPNYPSLSRKGRVLCAGPDGCIVLHHPSGHEERVRYEDIRKGKEEDKAKKKTIAKSANSSNQDAGKAGAQAQRFPATVQRLPFQVGHAVKYQRPDMGEPRIGKIDTIGRHGAVVSLANGARHKVRWEHVQGRAQQAGIVDAERGEVVDVLSEMGLPMDELDALLSTSRKPRADGRLLDQLTALAAGGAPIDTKRASSASRSTLERLRDHLTVTERAM